MCVGCEHRPAPSGVGDDGGASFILERLDVATREPACAFEVARVRVQRAAADLPARRAQRAPVGRQHARRRTVDAREQTLRHATLEQQRAQISVKCPFVRITCRARLADIHSRRVLFHVARRRAFPSRTRRARAVEQRERQLGARREQPGQLRREQKVRQPRVAHQTRETEGEPQPFGARPDVSERETQRARSPALRAPTVGDVGARGFEQLAVLDAGRARALTRAAAQTTVYVAREGV